MPGPIFRGRRRRGGPREKSEKNISIDKSPLPCTFFRYRFRLPTIEISDARHCAFGKSVNNNPVRAHDLCVISEMLWGRKEGQRRSQISNWASAKNDNVPTPTNQVGRGGKARKGREKREWKGSFGGGRKKGGEGRGRRGALEKTRRRGDFFFEAALRE